MKLILVVLFYVTSINLYAYSVGINYGSQVSSSYNSTYGAYFYDVNNNEIPLPVADDRVGGITYGSHGSHGASSSVGINFSFDSIVSQTDDVCSEITTDCATQRFESFNSSYNNYSWGQTYVNDTSTSFGTAQQDMYIETYFSESGSAFFKTDNPELFHGLVKNPLLDSTPEGVFDFVWEETTTTQRKFIPKGDQWVYDDGYTLNSYAENALIYSSELKDDFTQFYVGEENFAPISAVPLPAGVLLFGSGLVSLFGFLKSKENNFKKTVSLTASNDKLTT